MESRRREKVAPNSRELRRTKSATDIGVYGTLTANTPKLVSGDKVRTVIVEGNIGSGKSTLLQHFQNNPKVRTYPEPIDRWRDVRGFNTLSLMYSFPKQFSHVFQSYVQQTMLENHMNAQRESVKLMERSVYSARYCFTENLFQSKLMTDVEYAVLEEWFDWIVGQRMARVDLIVYLRTQPEVIHERIQKRDRSEESSCSLEYLRALHDLHDEWLIKRTKFSCPARVLVIDGNVSRSEMFQTLVERCREILGEVV